MSMSAFRKMVSCVLVMGFPVSIFAADSCAAMLHSHGVAWLNGLYVPASSAIFSGDLLQTRSDSAADINAPGASISVLSDSLVRFAGSSLKVEHGGVSVARGPQARRDDQAPSSQSPSNPPADGKTKGKAQASGPPAAAKGGI